ncbi:hypothetical protein PDN64_15525 [Bacillus cereus group sp. Bc256]|uniref:hypothetical protein n=1 Tax=Bacillus cereus group sp. Bc256 TaxID=3018102 RepID=UPI0022E8C8A8|nr:hypothetical protein [Bacillus cereus group sp. Bc256]MDA2139521.1 hypothetical protein [Bacillus cereus group sp. Bc256]
MKNNIFYSWQSDLPNNTNRNFIESCLTTAIKELKKTENSHLELNVDRDTKDELGTPDIVNTIFSKIERSNLFIADISIINSQSSGRKMPNPNVLMELGYAAKVLGWDRVICVFNTDYGNFDDLPFDLKFRRPLIYGLEAQDKPKVKAHLVKVIKHTIQELYASGMLGDELNDYLKMQVDTQILSIARNIDKILYGYTEKISFDNYSRILSLEFNEIKELIIGRKFVGFQVFKKFKKIENELTMILKDIISSNYYKKEMGIAIVNIIKWLNRFDKFNSLRESPNLFIYAGERVNGYKAVFSEDINPKNEEGYILLRSLNDSHAQVVDFGEITEQQKVDLMLNYVYINEDYIVTYVEYICEFNQLIEKWLLLTNNEFIVDNLNHFEINKEVMQKKMKRVLSKPESLKEKLLALFESDLKFDYLELTHMNAILHLNRLGYIFKNHQEILDNLQRYIKGKVKKNEDLLFITLDEELVKKDLSENERKRGMETLTQVRKGIVNIEYIYIPNAFANLIDDLRELTVENSIPDNLKLIIFDIIKDVKENLFVHLSEVLKDFIVDTCNEGNLNLVDQFVVYDEFNGIRQYHEKNVHALKSEIRKLLKQSVN